MMEKFDEFNEWNFIVLHLNFPYKSTSLKVFPTKPIIILHVTMLV